MSRNHKEFQIFFHVGLGRAASTFLQYKFYKNIFNYLSGLVLTPVGFTFFILGLFIKSNRQGESMLHSWLFGIIIFYGVFHKHAHTHEYYYLPFLPLASLMIGKFWARLFEENNDQNIKIITSKPFKLLAGWMFLLMILGYSNSGFKIPEGLRNFNSEIRVINENTRDEDLMLVSRKYQLYYGRNRGWVFGLNDPFLKKRFHYLMQGQPFSLNGILEKFREAGAAYYLVSPPNLFLAQKEFSDYIYKHYPVVQEIEGVCILFDLRNTLASGT